MKIVINIPDEIYKRCRNYSLQCGQAEILEGAVAQGTPLPKGHGRLIDADYLLDRIGLDDNDENREENVGEVITLEDFDFTPTIIEADKEEEE